MAKLHGKFGLVQMAATSGTPVVGETPSGAVNGANTTFTTANQNVDLMTVYIDAVAQTFGAEWVVSPVGSIEFVTAPTGGEAVTCDYTHFAMASSDDQNGFFEWSLEYTADVEECTAFEDDGIKVFVVGATGWTASASKYMDSSASLSSRNGTRAIVKFWLDDTNDYRYEGWGIFTAVNTTVPVDGLVEEPLTLQGTEGLFLETT